MQTETETREYTRSYDDFGIVMTTGEKGRIVLDIDHVIMTYRNGIGGQPVITNVSFFGANLNLYHNDREHIDILAGWGWSWKIGTAEREMTSIDVLTDDMQRILVDTLIAKESE